MQRFYIDVNSAVGRRNFIEKRIPYTVDSLLSDMKYCRIHASLVYSNVARDYSFVKGNEELIETVKYNDRIFGAAVVIPETKYEFGSNYQYLDMLVCNGIKAFRMFPTKLAHGFDAFSIEDLANYMIARKLPLIIDIGETNWNSLREILLAYPELKILLCKTSWGDSRHLFYMMEKFSNLYFELSANQSNGIFETSRNYFGVDRVLFGSDYPNRSMGCLKALVEYADASEEEKDMVAHINAAKLFGIDAGKLVEYPEAECELDEIARLVDNGMPLTDHLIIDAHTHIGEKEHKAVSSIPLIDGDADSIIHKMNRLGIDSILTSPWEGLCTAGDSGNETSWKACRKYPGRIEAYATFNPSYAEEDLDSLINVYHEKYKFIGLKPYHPLHGFPLTDKHYEQWFKYGDKNRLMMLVHSDSPEITDWVGELSGKYKNMTFVLAHSGFYYGLAEHNIEVARKCDNVYLEITYTSLTNGIIEYMVEELGADRILYGSDLPLRDPAPQLAWVCYSKISLEAKKKIMGENVWKLLQRCYIPG